MIVAVGGAGGYLPIVRCRLRIPRLESHDGPDIDLLIRTSGEQRLSDFLLWESAYAELHFTKTLWPDFDDKELARAVEEYQRRDRRFGQLPHLVEAAS